MTPTIHATCLLIGPHGVLIRGPAGAGKTSLALALIEACHAEGRFARLVADDRVHVEPLNGRLVARTPAEIAGKVERRGLGIVRIAHEPAAVVAFVFDIVGDDAFERLPEPASRRIAMEGVELVRIAVPRSLEHAKALVLAVVGTEVPSSAF